MERNTTLYFCEYHLFQYNSIMNLKSLLLSAILAIAIFSNTFGQSIIKSENFDSVIFPVSPAGWLSNNVAGTEWRTDSTNSSSGYSNASGINNMLVRNTDPSGTYILTSPSVSTIGFTNILVTWDTRVSVNYTASGSTTPIFDYSINGGANWINLPYTDNPSNSIWFPVNGGIDIALPSNATNVADLKFRWTVNIVTDPNGSYRLDDFIIKGTTVTNTHDYSSSNSLTIYPNPSQDIITFTHQASNEIYTLSIYDMTGQKITSINHTKLPYQLSCSSFNKGIYFAQLENESGVKISSAKFIVQ